MATITSAQQTQILKITAGLFNAAPGAAYLSEFASAVTGGMSMLQLSNALANTSAFTIGVMGGKVTATAQTTQLMENFGLTYGATDAASVGAQAWFMAQINAGRGFGEIIYDAVTALSDSAWVAANSDYAGVAAALSNKAAVSEYYSATLGQSSSELATLQAVVAGVTATTPVATPEELAAAIGATGGKVFTLTTSVDTLTGTASNDTFTAQDTYVGAAWTNTLSGLDVLNGGAGVDTLNVFDQNSAINVSGSNVSNIEVVNLTGAAAVSANTTGWTGVETLAVKQAGGAVGLTAAATTDVTATGLGNFGTTVTGGKSVTVTQAMDATGDAITINGAGDVTVTATKSAAAAGGIAIGGTTAVTGAVSVSSKGADVAFTADAAATTVTMDTVAVTGGTTVSVTQDANSVSGTAATLTDNAADKIVQGAVTVTGGNATTTVSVVQSDQVAGVAAVAAVTGVKATQTVTFNALVTGNSVTVNGLTFTASKNLTAAEVAAAFSNLTSGDRQDASGATGNGTYSGQFTAGFTTAAANGAVVTLTETTAGTNAAVVGVATAQNGGVSAPTAPTAAAGVTGVTAVTAVTGVAGVANGAVTINDNATKSIKTITVDGYSAGATLGATGSLDALTSLTLKNSGAGAAALTTTSVGSIALTLDDVDGTVNLDAGGATITGLTITTQGTASTGAITAAAATNVTINAGAALSGAHTLTAATQITVNGTATVDLTGATTNAATLATINASGNTGGVTAVLGNTNSVAFTGGAGNDSLTLGNTTIAATKNILLGAGNDTLTIAAGTVAGGISASVDGGTGTDTIAMGYADAVAVSASTALYDKLTGFEHLTINDVTGVNAAAVTYTVDLSKLAFNYVTVNGTNTTGATDTLALTGMAANGTVAFGGSSTAGSTYTVALADATGTADVLNYVLASTNETSATAVADTTLGTANNGGTITANAVETFNISTSAVDKDGATNVITANGNAVTTINASGNASLNLTSTATTLVTVNAGGLTAGGLTFTAGNANMTVTGGAGADVISIGAAADNSTFSGGAGNDSFSIAAGADLVKITGGAGTDTFDFNGVSTNKSNFVVLNGVDTGDVLDLNGLAGMNAAGANTFKSAQITLSQGATQSTQAYLDQAITTLAQNETGWFQYNGNTYVVTDLSNNANAFLDGTDFVTMIVGTVDLSKASFNATVDTLQIA